jgi:RimJ/RimL family protein N-acetyltransferase
MLQGELTNLRAIERADVALIHRWLDDHELMRWWGYGVRAVSLASVQQNAEQWIDDERVFGHPLAFIIETLGGDPIGMIILSDVQPIDRSAELSCFLDAAARGEGFGRDAVGTAIDAAFAQWNYHRLTARCEALNVRAHAFFETNGFELEGRLRHARFIDGAWSDVLVFGRIRDEEINR